jgi:putative nucleotidyltransferase with HDIG domain
MISIQGLIKEIDNLKPIPQIAGRVMKMAEDPGCSLRDIADVILHDPLITANLLRICNAAYFGLPRQIDSVQDAITLLGLQKIVDLVLLKCCIQVLGRQQRGYGLHEGELWRTAVSGAVIARKISEREGTQSRQLIFTAALLKDIGKVILDRFVADSFEQIDDFIKNDGLSFNEAEKKAIGIDHAELGALVAKKWNLSPKMVYIIRNHHMSEESARKDFETSVVYLADMLCMMMGIGGGVDGLAYRFHDEVMKRLNITEMDFQAIIADFGENMQKLDALLEAV